MQKNKSVVLIKNSPRLSIANYIPWTEYFLIIMDNFDLNVYLYNQPRFISDKEEVVHALYEHHAVVADCNDERNSEILKNLNEHNYFIFFTDGSHPPIGFSCANENYVIENMVKTILKSLKNE